MLIQRIVFTVDEQPHGSAAAIAKALLARDVLLISEAISEGLLLSRCGPLDVSLPAHFSTLSFGLGVDINTVAFVASRNAVKNAGSVKGRPC